VPNNAPTAAVIPMASAPQNTTRVAPINVRAPPARAARAPSNPRNAREELATMGTSLAGGVRTTITSGKDAPIAKVAADVSAACTGRAVKAAETPSSSHGGPKPADALSTMSLAMSCAHHNRCRCAQGHDVSLRTYLLVRNQAIETMKPS